MDRLAEIEQLEVDLITESRVVMSLGNAWKSEWMILGSIKRSLGLASGFRTMIEARNFTCAAPLVRMQLDCGLRLSALTVVRNADDYASAFIAGEKMDKFKSKSGMKLTDRYLVNQLKGDMPWVEKVYDEACAFIHLSSRALWSSIAKTDDGAQTVYFQLSAIDPIRGGDEKYFDAIEAFKMTFLLTKAITLSHLQDREAALARS